MGIFQIQLFMKTNAYQGFWKNIYENGKAQVLYKSQVHETAMLLSRQLAMGNWKPESAADIKPVSRCNGNFAQYWIFDGVCNSQTSCV